MNLASFLNNLLPVKLRPLPWAARRYLYWSRCVVQSGPFRGLRYIREAHCSQLAPKIAGTYERELHPFLERLVASRPDVFIDVGAAEGYYAVGSAVAGWSPRIVAFESESDARRALLELAALNNLSASRIELREACSPSALDSLLGEHAHPAVIMDVEGFEALLLDPLRLPNLRRALILLEHHDFVLPGLRDVLIERMQPTHDIEIIGQIPRSADEFVCSDPLLRRLPDGIRRRILDERRPSERHGWLWLTPRT
jgi:hypothetical protein